MVGAQDLRIDCYFCADDPAVFGYTTRRIDLGMLVLAVKYTRFYAWSGSSCAREENSSVAVSSVCQNSWTHARLLGERSSPMSAGVRLESAVGKKIPTSKTGIPSCHDACCSEVAHGVIAMSATSPRSDGRLGS